MYINKKSKVQKYGLEVLLQMMLDIGISMLTDKNFLFLEVSTIQEKDTICDLLFCQV